MKTFHCDQCGQSVFFENTHCENCGGMLGYQPEQHAISTFEPAGDDLWRSLNPANAGLLYKQCINYSREDVCNWMLDADDPEALCTSCQLTRVIPSLGFGQNRLYWKRMESAKRRLLYSLWELDLKSVPKSKDAHAGLAFEFLEDMPDKHVITGHANGVITLNVAEADPSHREKTREQMHEPYRTLLGHLRHESGHYYFDRLIADTEWLPSFREMFGDEREDYAAALQRNYTQGPPPDWENRFISAYASAHPWEDWAETWAHYLHMFDCLDTAFHRGIVIKPKQRGDPALAFEAHPLRITSFTTLMANWFALTYVLNDLNRSIGMPDAYPFALSPIVRNKLKFIHQVIGRQT